MEPKLEFLKAKVGHARLWPKKNSFLYNVFYLKATVSENMDYKTPALFSFNSWNVLSIKIKDHGAKDKKISWHSYIVSELKKAGIPFKSGYTVELISHPRLFGYAFNPISYWLIIDESSKLRAVFCEVRNTFRQSHNYLLAKKDNSPILPTDVLSSKKNLYVSPYNKIEGYYEFNFEYENNKFKSVINYFDDTRQILNTYMGGELSDVSSAQIIKSVIKYPFMTLRVVFLIHWQAVKLLFKKVKPTLRNKPKIYDNNETSISNKN